MSAESRFPAMSKEVLVRVDGSAKKRTTLLPRRVGTFFTGGPDRAFRQQIGETGVGGADRADHAVGVDRDVQFVAERQDDRNNFV